MSNTPAPPPPPRHLSSESRALWRELNDACAFDPQDLKTLRLALEALDRCNMARRVIRREGMTYTDRFGAPHAHPCVAIERDSRQAWLRLMAALDLPAEEEADVTPDHRSRAARARAFRNRELRAV
jgi:P27 family predicted phage terminase small subunit